MSSGLRRSASAILPRSSFAESSSQADSCCTTGVISSSYLGTAICTHPPSAARRHRITIFAPGRTQRTACRMASSGMAMQPDVLEPPPMQCRKMQDPFPASPAAL